MLIFKNICLCFRELCEPLELQLDYWLLPGKPNDIRGDSGGGGGGKGKSDSSKSTLKSTFRSLQVARLPLSGEQPSPHFTISYATKEKKQKSKFPNFHTKYIHMLKCCF